jgi:hypothetical protein
MKRLRIVPCSLRRANDFVEAYHRHNRRTARDGGKFAIALADGDLVVGVAIVGNPLSATFMDGFTAEVLRTCLSPDAPRNANSMLYGACRRIWFEMGGAKIETYNLPEESGSSLKGAGWVCAATVKGHDAATWGKQDHLRRREQAIIAKGKRRWEAINPDVLTGAVQWPAALTELSGTAQLDFEDSTLPVYSDPLAGKSAAKNGDCTQRTGPVEGEGARGNNPASREPSGESPSAGKPGVQPSGQIPERSAK